MAGQKDRKVSIQDVDKFFKKVEADAKDMDDSVAKAIAKVKEDFDKKRKELKTKVANLKNEQKKLLDNFKQTDAVMKDDIYRLGMQLDAMTSAEQAMPQVDTQAEAHRRSQQMIQIFADSSKDMDTLIKDHRERLRRYEKGLQANVVADRTLLQLGTQTVANDVTQIKTLVEQKNILVKDLASKLEDIQRDIERKTKYLIDEERREEEEMTDAEKKCVKAEAAERRTECNNFLKKAKDALN